jgi:hypothetical protein
MEPAPETKTQKPQAKIRPAGIGGVRFLPVDNPSNLGTITFGGKGFSLGADLEKG